jgi:hypothetical protein
MTAKRLGLNAPARSLGGHGRMGHEHRAGFEQVAGVRRTDGLGARRVRRGRARAGQDDQGGGEVQGGGRGGVHPLGLAGFGGKRNGNGSLAARMGLTLFTPELGVPSDSGRFDCLEE